LISDEKVLHAVSLGCRGSRRRAIKCTMRAIWGSQEPTSKYGQK
jgi:hypothetical protein